MATETSRYLEHLSERDLSLLASAAGLVPSPDGSAEALRARPGLIEQALADPHVFAAVLGPRDTEILHVSPFLVFSVAVHRTAADVCGLVYVEERVGRHRRLPVFDIDPLRVLGADPDARLFMIELLASFTRTSGGAVWVRRGARGWRRLRFSDMDPVRLATLLDVVPESEHAGIYRRLGDLALFLSGVFPDHVARGPSSVELARLLRTLPERERGTQLLEGVERATTADGLGGLLELLGPRWYRLAAARLAVVALTAPLHRAAERFDPARRFLRVVTDRYLLPLRADWFPQPGGN